MARTNGSAAEAAPLAVFTSDLATTGLRDRQTADFLAELAVHRAVETPLCIGILGPAGSGKTTVLNDLLGSATALSQGAERAGDTPFLDRVAVASVHVGQDGSAETVLLTQVADALSASYPQLVDDCLHAGLDPETTARDLGDRLNTVRQSLDAERGKLDELSSRHARILETCLFESSGSSIDAYARANRVRIDRSLKRFGFAPGSAEYKDLVRTASTRGNGTSRWLSGLPAFWTYRGQTKLIVYALLLFAIAWGLGLVMANQDSLVEQLRASNDKMGPTADWLQAHAGWLGPLKTLAIVGGLVALATNLVRGFRFLQPVVKGAEILQTDVSARRRDLDGLLAHQTRRVDALSQDAERLAQQAADADRRLEARKSIRTGKAGARSRKLSEREAAHAFFTNLGAALAHHNNQKGEPVPHRIVVGLDGLENLSSEQAAATLKSARALLNQPGFVTIVAADQSQAANGLADADPALAASHLDRMIQIPINLAAGGSGIGSGDIARSILAGGDPVTAPTPRSVATSALDTPWQSGEAAVLEALAPLAGSTPRSVKRLINLYRVARADPRLTGANAAGRAGLAVALTLQNQGVPLDASQLSTYEGPFAGDFAAAQDAVSRVLGRRLDTDNLRTGLEVAKRYRV